MKKLFKIFVWAAGIFIALLLLIVIAFKLFFPAEKAKVYAIEKAETFLNRKVTIEAIDISIWGGLGLQLVGVTVSNPQDFSDQTDFLTAENVDVKMRLWPLLFGEFRVDRFILNRPQISLIKSIELKNNYTFESADSIPETKALENIPGEAVPAVAAISFETFEINNGTIVYKNYSDQSELILSGINFHSSLVNPTENRFQSIGELAIESVLLESEESFPEVKVSLEYDAELDLTNKRLVLEESALELNDISFRLSGQLSDFTSAPKGRFTIKSESVLAEQLIELLPSRVRKSISDYTISGELSMTIDLEYDQQKTTPFSYSGTLSLNKVRVTTRMINATLQFDRAFIDFKPDNVRANIEGGTIDGQPFKGHVIINDFANPELNGDLTGSIDLAVFDPLIDKEDKFEFSGKTELDLRFSGRINDSEQLVYSGNLKMLNGKFKSELLPEPIDSLYLDLYIDNKVTTVRRIAAKSKSAELLFSGRFENVINYFMADSLSRLKLPAPLIVGELSGSSDLALLNGYLEKTRAARVTGKTSFNLKVSGNPVLLTSLKPYGNLSISDGSYYDSTFPEPIKHFSATMTVVADTFKVDSMKIEFESSDVSLSGKIIQPVPYFLTYLGIIEGTPPKPLFELDIISRRFNVDKMFPEAVPGSEAVTAKLPSDTVPELIVPDMNGRGTFSIDTLIYSQIEFTNIKGLLRVQDRRMESYNVTGNVYSGRISGETTIDLNDFSKPQYNGKFKATSIEADDFVSRFTKMGGFLFGKININGDYNAQGWDRQAFLNSLSMNGLAQMNKGKLVTSDSIHQKLNFITKKLKLPFDKEQTIRNLSSKITVKDGKVGLDNLKTSLGVIGDLELGGFYSFDGELDYTGSILLSKEQTKKIMSELSKNNLLGGLAGLLNNKSVDRLRLPIKLGGTVDKPKPEIDMAALTGNAGKNLLQNLFKKFSENK